MRSPLDIEYFSAKRMLQHCGMNSPLFVLGSVQICSYLYRGVFLRSLGNAHTLFPAEQPKVILMSREMHQLRNMHPMKADRTSSLEILLGLWKCKPLLRMICRNCKSSHWRWIEFDYSQDETQVALPMSIILPSTSRAELHRKI